MKYNAFMQFHVEIGDLMKAKKKTLLKHELLRENWYENLLSAKFVGIPAKRNYAAKIRKVIEEMMEEDWSDIQNGIE